MGAMAAAGDRSLMSPDNQKQSIDAAPHSPESVLDLDLGDAPKTTSDHDPYGHGHAAHPTLGAIGRTPMRTRRPMMTMLASNGCLNLNAI